MCPELYAYRSLHDQHSYKFSGFHDFSEFDSKIIIVNSPFEILHDYGIYKGDDNLNL